MLPSDSLRRNLLRAKNKTTKHRSTSSVHDRETVHRLGLGRENFTTLQLRTMSTLSNGQHMDLMTPRLGPHTNCPSTLLASLEPGSGGSWHMYAVVWDSMISHCPSIMFLKDWKITRFKIWFQSFTVGFPQHFKCPAKQQSSLAPDGDDTAPKSCTFLCNLNKPHRQSELKRNSICLIENDMFEHQNLRWKQRFQIQTEAPSCCEKLSREFFLNGISFKARQTPQFSKSQRTFPNHNKNQKCK